MQRTAVAIYHDLSGKKPVRRGTITGQEVEETGASTPTEKVTEQVKAL